MNKPFDVSAGPDVAIDLASEAQLKKLNDDPEFRPWIVARYKYWTVYLNIRDQGLPGRVYAWLNRHLDDMDMEELRPKELFEFNFHILPAITSALKSLWPQHIRRFNIEWLGNEFEAHRGHGHFHVTPRFNPVTLKVGEREFKDENCNARRATPKFKPAKEEAQYILERLRACEQFKYASQ